MKVERKQVKEMFLAAGWTTAKEWGDERVNEKIEKINELNVEVPEDETLAKLLKTIQKAVKAGEIVELVDKAPKAEGKLSPENKKLKAEFEEATAEGTKPKKNTKADKESAAEDKARQKHDAEQAAQADAEGEDDSEEETRPPVGWVLKAATVQEVTPKLAKEFADMEATLVERPFKQKKADYYLELLLNNEFAPCRFASAYCNETKKTYRINGQHCSRMFVAAAELGKENLKGQKVYVEEYECDTLADVAQLFATFDSKEQARSSADITHAVAQTIDKVRDVDAKLVNLAVGAVNYAMGPTNQGGGRHLTAADRANVLYDNDAFVIWLKGVVGQKKDEETAFLWRVPVVAAMWATWEKNAREAKAFWLEVKDGTNKDPQAPTRKFQKWLLTQPTSGGRGDGTPQKAKVVPKEFYVRAVSAWNAHKTGEPMKSYKSTEGFPEVA